MKKIILITILIISAYLPISTIKTSEANYTPMDIVGVPFDNLAPLEDDIIQSPRKTSQIVSSKFQLVPSTIITTRINAYRENPLQESAILNAQACRRARYLTDNDIWYHDKVEFLKWFDLQLWERPDRKVVGMGENLSYRKIADYPLVVEQWLNSPSHAAVMLNPIYNYHGWCEYKSYIVSVFTE